MERGEKREGGSGGKVEGREEREGGQKRGGERREEGDRIQRSGREKGSDKKTDSATFYLIHLSTFCTSIRTIMYRVSMYRNVIR